MCFNCVILSLVGLAFARDDAISLLQSRAVVHSHSNASQPDWQHKWMFNTCASDAFHPGWRALLNYSEEELGYCRCWGSGHCSHVPFDQRPISHKEERHYQHNGVGASRYAKAADGSWEIQIFQCGCEPLGCQVGVAVKVQGVTVEVSMENPPRCFVNGVEQPQNQYGKVQGKGDLPNGFHWWCPESPNEDFCAMYEGQFLSNTNMWYYHSNVNQVTGIPRSVAVQEAGTVCYDSSSANNPEILFGIEISQTAIVPADEVIFTPAALAALTRDGTRCGVQHQEPVNPNGPQTPEATCNEHGANLTRAQEVCAPLKDDHPGFYDDCCVDECLRQDPDEEDDIEGMAEDDEPKNCSDLPQYCSDLPQFTLKQPVYSNLGGAGPDDGEAAILYPDAGLIDGELVDVKLTSDDFQSHKAALNGVAGDLGVLNHQPGTNGTLTFTVVSKAGEEISVDGMAITVLDLDEGKRGKGRAKVTVCDASCVEAGTELTTTSVVGGCQTVSSSKHGKADNNPTTVAAVSGDQKRRAVTLIYSAGSSFSFSIEHGSASSGGRNLLFALDPSLC